MSYERPIKYTTNASAWVEIATGAVMVGDVGMDVT